MGCCACRAGGHIAVKPSVMMKFRRCMLEPSLLRFSRIVRSIQIINTRWADAGDLNLEGGIVALRLEVDHPMLPEVVGARYGSKAQGEHNKSAFVCIASDLPPSAGHTELGCLAVIQAPYRGGESCVTNSPTKSGLQPSRCYRTSRAACRGCDRRVLNGIFWILRSGEPWRDFSPYLYRARNKVERFFNRIKQCRRVATCYDKLAATVLLSSSSHPSGYGWLRVMSPRPSLSHTDGSPARGETRTRSR